MEIDAVSLTICMVDILVGGITYVGHMQLPKQIECLCSEPFLRLQAADVILECECLSCHFCTRKKFDYTTTNILNQAVADQARFHGSRKLPLRGTVLI